MKRNIKNILIKCLACEQENAVENKFCSLCGLPLPPRDPNTPTGGTICSSCLASNPAGSFFCYSCGNYFLAGEEKTSGNGSRKSEQDKQVQSSGQARIVMPGRPDIPLNTDSIFIERNSFDSTLPQDVLMSISRQHVLITFDKGIYYIQDYGRDGTGSTNHTRLNGKDIHHKGRQPLKDGDLIELAHQSELILTFRQP